ncbi:MAG TPA: zinc ribbon domain-containing protein [Polyangiaceae bacterium]|jgi:hypothetical protein|nr:zinc ribbon domain-containing protein [Polyangiaceae bacterium]
MTAATPAEAAEAREAGAAGEDAERALGRAVAIGLPVLTVISAIVVGAIASVGSGLLVVASGALLGTIALLWASVRTLSGDAPLPVDLETLAGRTHDVDALAEEKRRVLRALKDIESEHAVGKLDDADYEAIAAQYRQEAKALMREMDDNAAPALAEAEKIAREYLAAQGLGATGEVTNATAVSPAPKRIACPTCEVSNEPDAAFCKKCGANLGEAAATGSPVAPREAAREKDGDATS